MVAAPTLSFDLNSTLVVAVEISQSAWVIAAHVPGLEHVKVRRRIKARGEALLLAIEQLKRRVPTPFKHIIITYEAGYSGFWLARLLQQHGIEVYVIQPVSIPVDRRQRRAKRTPLTLTFSCEPAWLSCGVSRVSAPWCRSRTRMMRTPGIWCASAKISWPSGSG